MPLIIISGLPTSGKSTRAGQLHEYLAKRIVDSKYRLHLISDESLSISRTVYDLSPDKVPAHTRSANASEKDARAAIYGAVKRVLSDKDIVILDGLNYIKGWRYQLHCESKAVRTPSCILQVGCAVDRAKQVNEERLRRRNSGGQETAQDGHDDEEQISEGQVDEVQDTAEPYEQGNWDNLVFRYEEPNPMTRWDSPLFTLIWQDDEQQATKVFSDLWDTIAGEGRRVVRPNQSTVQRGRDAGGDYLYNLDRETSDIVKRIIEAQREDDGMDEVRIPRSSGGPQGDDGLTVDLPAGSKVGLPQLQRLRRAYMGLNRGGIGLETVGNMSAQRIRETFVRYLNDAFETDE
ncbi:chromatin associated protein KTI12 [Dactylonectria estremocensis]|uniref:Chromatin associated protein KTI12 n=1 Tax=Dactylonectria estremocensis TaxID=1079267 RepID=A0A9P9FDS5_9HYPO|nr:chromatin associated protein KTI12 [Dactylonectria estremocensis]